MCVCVCVCVFVSVFVSVETQTQREREREREREKDRCSELLRQVLAKRAVQHGLYLDPFSGQCCECFRIVAHMEEILQESMLS